MKSYKFFNQHGCLLADSNIAHGGVYSSAVDLSDAILASKNGNEMLKNLKKLKLVGFYNPEVDFDKKDKARIKFNDAMGNIRYIEAVKEDDLEVRTVYYRITVKNTGKYGDLQSLLILNGYKCKFVDGNTIFVSEDEDEELITILKDEGCVFSFE